jgi:hypothetical protein
MGAPVRHSQVTTLPVESEDGGERKQKVSGVSEGWRGASRRQAGRKTLKSGAGCILAQRGHNTEQFSPRPRPGYRRVRLETL